MCAPCSMSVAAHLKARSFKQTARTDAALAGAVHEGRSRESMNIIMGAKRRRRGDGSGESWWEC